MKLFRRSAEAKPRPESATPVEVRSPLADKDEAVAVGTIAGVLGVGIPEALAIQQLRRASATGHPEAHEKPENEDQQKPAGALRPGVGRAGGAHPPKTD